MTNTVVEGINLRCMQLTKVLGVGIIIPGCKNILQLILIKNLKSSFPPYNEYFFG